MKTKWKHIFPALLVLVLISAVLVFPGWAENSETWEEPVFTFQNMADLTVYVDGALSGELTRTCDAGEVVTLNAPEVSGKAFSHWAVGSADGPVASELGAYRLAVNADIALYAVYKEGEPADARPAVAFTAVTRREEPKALEDQENPDETKEPLFTSTIRFTATYSVPGSAKVTDAGIFYTDNRLLGMGTNDKLTETMVSGLDVEALLTSDAEDPRVRKVPASSEGLTLVYNGDVLEDTPYSNDPDSPDYKAVWTTEDGSWALNQADWTMALVSPGEDVPVYAVAYVTTSGETYYSPVMTAVYQELGSGVTAVYVPPEMDIAGEEGITPDDLDAAVRAALGLAS